MEPRTNKKFDRATFERQRKRIADYSSAKRKRMSDPAYSTSLPQDISLQLTYACNLRCKMCYQWNDDGYFNTFSAQQKKMEIDVDLFNKILDESKEAKSTLYIWGGEPLFHSDFEGISRALERDRRYTTMCTNGLLVEKNMESLLRISPDLALLFSIDGLGETNDKLRGNRTFERLMAQMYTLLDEQKRGNFKGTISVNTVLNDDLAPHIYEFMEYFDAMGVDSVYFNYPWYISEERAAQMDQFYADNLQWLGSGDPSGKQSWHSFTFKLSPASIPVIEDQISKLKKRVWNSRVRFQQHMEGEQIAGFIRDTFSPDRSCYAWSTRMEILADGKAGTCCKFFPELSVGNIREEGLLGLWKSEKFKKLREVLNRQLMPVCSKCILLYRNGR